MATYALYNGAIEIIHSFKAANLTDAQTVAQSMSTLLATPVRLLPHAAPTGQTEFSYTPGSQGTTVSCPSGVTGFAPTNS